MRARSSMRMRAQRQRDGRHNLTPGDKDLRKGGQTCRGKQAFLTICKGKVRVFQGHGGYPLRRAFLEVYIGINHIYNNKAVILGQDSCHQLPALALKTPKICYSLHHLKLWTPTLLASFLRPPSQ